MGTDGWGDNSVYKLGDHVTKGAVFASPFLEGKLSDEFMTLAGAYDSRYGKRPQRLASLGFDAVRLLTNAASSGGGRESIIKNLELVKNYNGASGKISFGEYHENIEMPLYKIENEKAISIDNIDAEIIE